jgi:phage tail-like protein
MPAKQEIFNPAIWFKLDIQGKPVGYFTEVSGLTAEIETHPYKEGGRNEFEHKLPSRMKFPNLVLKRGMTTVKDLQTWFADSYMGPSRTTVQLTMLNEHGDRLRTWSFDNAYPVKWTGPQFNSSQNTVATEAIEITHDGIKVVP